MREELCLWIFSRSTLRAMLADAQDIIDSGASDGHKASAATVIAAIREELDNRSGARGEEGP